MSYNDFDVDKARALREKAKDSFVRQFRWEFVTTVAVSLPVWALIGYAAMKFGQAAEPGLRVSYAVLYVLAGVFGLVVWVAHGLNARLLFVTKEIKQLRLDFLSSQESPLEHATGGAESFGAWVSLAMRPRLLFALVGLVLLAATVILFAYGEKQMEAQDDALWEKRTYNNGIYEEWRARAFGGDEEVEVHFTRDGAVRVFSRVTITKSPDYVAPVPIRISQPGATLESVSINGKKTSVVPVPGMTDTYSLMPGMAESAVNGATLEVVWSIPIAEMGFVRDRGFQFRLLGTLPVGSYTAKPVIDEGVPYQFVGELAPVKSYPMFTTKHDDYNAGEMGYCGIRLHYVQPEEQPK